MDEQEKMMRMMLEEDFQQILKDDPVLDELEKAKYDPQSSFFELMMILSKTFTVSGVVVSCITPAIWSYLYAIGSPYATGEECHEIDTDIMLYILHNGIHCIDSDIIDKAHGFCASHGVDHKTAEADLKTLIYLSFRPLEMIPTSTSSQSGGKARYDADWMTHLASVVCPLTGKTSDDVIYDMSLTECYYYCIQKARETDVSGNIRRRNSSEVNALIYKRTMELGEEYLKHIDESAKSEA